MKKRVNSKWRSDWPVTLNSGELIRISLPRIIGWILGYICTILLCFGGLLFVSPLVLTISGIGQRTDHFILKNKLIPLNFFNNKMNKIK